MNDGDDDSAGNVRGMSGPRVNAGDRLPVGVLLARARLVERLRGEPLSPNRYAFNSMFQFSFAMHGTLSRNIRLPFMLIYNVSILAKQKCGGISGELELEMVTYEINLLMR